jgi:ABC-type branched-subunit amino acid transport system substrate-binding protein
MNDLIEDINDDLSPKYKQMKTLSPRLKYYCAVVVLLALMALTGIGHTTAKQSRSGLTPQEKRGKQIYVKGESGAGEITAVLGSADLQVPATSFSCSNCHGLRGEGTKEGGLQPPPITWETLTRPHTSALTRRERRAYDDVTLARAISDGVDSTGTRLHPGMPSYKMTREQMADLIAYLKKLGNESDTETGVTDETIKIGAALPLTGTLAQVGEDVRATLAASCAEINEQGGIYGRRFELVVEDSRGDSAQTLEATRRLIEQDGVFALLGSFEPGDSSAINQLIKSKEVPLIGPLTLSPRVMLPPNPYVFYLLPTFADQARTLLDFARDKSKERQARLGVVYAGNDFNQDALSGLKAQAAMYSLEIVSEQAYVTGNFKSAEIVELLARKKPDYVFFFGGAEDFKALGSEMERLKLGVPLLSSVVMVGRGAFALPANVAAQTFLSYPSALPNQEEFAEFLALLRKARVELRQPAFQSVAYAAMKIFLEAAKLSGRQLDRAALINSLEQLRDFKTGVIPPVTFGPNRRVGSTGSYIVGVDLSKQQYVPLTDRLMPKDKP